MTGKPATPRWRRVLRVVVLLLGALIMVAVVAFKTPAFISDLRTEPLGTAEAAKALLARLDAAHGSGAAWRSHAFVELKTQGEVGAFEARLGFDLSEPQPLLTLRFDPAGCGPFTMRLTAGPVIFAGEVGDASAGRQLLAASVRHLFEFPFAMASADVQHGMTVLDGHPRLFMSWGAAEPQMHIDQYVLWLGPDDRVVLFESTVPPSRRSCGPMWSMKAASRPRASTCRRRPRCAIPSWATG
ncbi:MAG: hypothetical protein KC620_13695 [Myxococcales bacterium]|nr:hypothetical protein [Myxococcales bacterium]